MADRIPLIVDSSSNQVKELPAGDSIILSDNEKIKLGTSGDLEIYHDGSNSVIVDAGTGGLFLRGTDTVDIQSASGHNYIKSTISAGTQIYYNNVEKFKTLSTGAQVTGLLTATTSANISQVALTSASSVAWDARAAANAFLLLGHNVTFAAPTNAVEGAIISVEIAQPDPTASGPHTVAWNTIFEFAASTAPTMTATGLKTDIFSFRYNGSIWQEIGRVQNLAQT
tara:strand:- start:583 stop:1260 length:678 start_codon:yes stop_codon:yes gene_type:complete